MILSDDEVNMARTKRTSVRPRLLRTCGKGPRLILVISAASRSLKELSSEKETEDKMEIVKSTLESLRFAIADGRFYHYLEKYIGCIQSVGIKFDAMVQSYVKVMVETQPTNDSTYLGMVESMSVLMHNACSLMQKCLHVADEKDLSGVCAHAQETICSMHDHMLEHVRWRMLSRSL